MRSFYIFALSVVTSCVVLYLIAMWSLSNIHFKGLPLIYRTNSFYQWQGGDTYHKLKLLEENPKVLVLGSSKAYRGIDCNVLSEQVGATLNLGTTAQNVCVSFSLLKEHLRFSKPDLLVIEISPISFESDGFESRVNLLANGVSMNLAQDLGIFKDIRYTNVFLSQKFKLSDESFYEKDGYQNCGSVLSDSSLPAEFAFPELDNEFLPGEEQKGCFSELVDFVQSEGINTIFINLPVPEESKGADIIKCSSYVHSCKRDIPYLELDDAEINTTEHFYDHIHLNAKGAKAVSLKLAKSVLKK